MPCDKCQASIPKIKGEWMAVLVWWVNVFAPGLGTAGSSCLGDGSCIMDQVLVGILQMITSPCIVGWLWSCWWGALVYKKHWN